MHDFKSHFWQDFLAYCTRPIHVHLAMPCITYSFDSFSIFLLSLKQQNLTKITVSCIRFPIWPYIEKKKWFLYFILVNCMGWQVWNIYMFALVRQDPITGIDIRVITILTPQKQKTKNKNETKSYFVTTTAWIIFSLNYSLKKKLNNNNKHFL